MRSVGVASRISVEFDKSKRNLHTDSMNTGHESGRALLEAIQGLARISYLEGKINVMQKSLHDVKSLLERILEIQPNSSEGWLDATDAAKYMGISKSTFEKYRADSEHMLRGYQIGGKYVYQKAELDRYIQTYAALKRM
jgi:excisionase family DNA binding protein